MLVKHLTHILPHSWNKLAYFTPLPVWEGHAEHAFNSLKRMAQMLQQPASHLMFVKKNATSSISRDDGNRRGMWFRLFKAKSQSNQEQLSFFCDTSAVALKSHELGWSLLSAGSTITFDSALSIQVQASPFLWWGTGSSRVWSLDSAARCLRGSTGRRTSPTRLSWRCRTWRSTTRRSATCWIPKGESDL